MNLRRLLLAFALPCFMQTVPAFAQDTNTIVIGQIIDLSSPNGSLGRDYVAGIKTCLDAVNAAGGIHGRKIRFVTRDDQGLPQRAATAAGELIEQERVDFLIGGVGNAVTQAILDTPAFKRSRLQLYAPLVGDNAMSTQPRLSLWRPDYLHEVRHVLSYFAQLGIKRVGIVQQETPDAARMLTMLQTELTAQGLQLTTVAKIGTDEKRNAQEAARLAASQPGFVIAATDTIGTGLFLREFRKHAPKVFVAGTSLANLDTLRELAGSRNVEWTVFSQVVPNPNANKSPLQREHLAMMNRYRDEPPSTLTLEGYAVAKTLVTALRRAKAGSLAQEFLRPGENADLGGWTLKGSGGRMSDYVDIALFRKNGLVF